MNPPLETNPASEADRWRSTLLKVAIALAVGAAALMGMIGLRSRFGIEFDPEALRNFIDGTGVWAPLALVAVVTFRLPLGLPSQVVLIAGGLCFGTFAGTLYGAIGIACSATGLFAIARWLGRDAIEQRVPVRLRPLIEAAGSKVGAAFLAVGTAYPFGPISAYHSMAGVTSISLPRFLLAVCSGAPIRAVTYTYFGNSLLSGDVGRIIAASGVIGIAAALPLLLPRPRAWVLQLLRRES